jgi:hypothetical protein
MKPQSLAAVYISFAFFSALVRGVDHAFGMHLVTGPNIAPITSTTTSAATSHLECGSLRTLGLVSKELTWVVERR